MLFPFRANETSQSSQCKTVRGSNKKSPKGAQIAAIRFSRFRDLTAAEEKKKLNSPAAATTTHLDAASSELVTAKLGARRGRHDHRRSFRSARHGDNGRREVVRRTARSVKVGKVEEEKVQEKSIGVPRDFFFFFSLRFLVEREGEEERREEETKKKRSRWRKSEGRKKQNSLSVLSLLSLSRKMPRLP